MLTTNIQVLSITFVYMYVKYLVDPMETVASRALTDKQTNRQTDKQTNRHTNILTNILPKTIVFESNEITQRVTTFENVPLSVKRCHT